MIICVCGQVTDDDIRQAVEQGALNFDAMLDVTDAAGNCGSCIGRARQVFDSAIATQASKPAVKA